MGRRRKQAAKILLSIYLSVVAAEIMTSLLPPRAFTFLSLINIFSLRYFILVFYMEINSIAYNGPSYSANAPLNIPVFGMALGAIGMIMGLIRLGLRQEKSQDGTE